MMWLKLIRWPNLVMLALMQVVIHYGFLSQLPFALALDHFHFALLVGATVILAAGGYLLNNFYDVESDTINHKYNPIGEKVSPDTIFNVYMVCNMIGVGIGFYLANHIGFNSFTGIFVIVAATLYLYSDSFQRIPVVKNLVIALLVAISVLVVAAFDLVPLMGKINGSTLVTAGAIVLDFAIFSFLLNWIREIIKDIEDIKGDYNSGGRTLPIIAGINRSRNLAIVLSVLATALLIFYTYSYFSNLLISSLFLAITVAFPLCVLISLLLKAKKPEHYKKPALLLKLIMLFGILSIAIIQWEIKHPII